ncbi:MAG TPA: glutathione S-transferase family protein [Steroidobacteraceae bacterium]|nr:glutathione S-transferase family protein [Steroidobacteraceae bacterium]
MRLYYHPVSTACRPVMLLAAEDGIDLEYKLVDLFKGEQLQPEFAAINPSRLVPALDDDGFILTEGSAILKYLADKAGSTAYPKELRQRARVNELMDWFNTGLYRDLGYGLVYPQTLPHHKRPDARVQAGVLEWGREKSRHWLGILDQHLLGPKGAWLAGNAVSLADYFGAAIVTLGEVIRLDYGAWPNVTRWLCNVKARPAWSKVNEAFYAHFVAPFKDAQFVGL